MRSSRLRAWEDAKGRRRLSLATRSDLSLEAQVTAPGATWLDRQLVAREPVPTGGGFGAEIRDAMARRAEHLVGEGLARRQGERVLFARGLIETLRQRELDATVERLAAETGLAHAPSGIGDYVTGIYRQRVTLASGRFAMIDDGLGFQLVPWRPALEQKLGQHVSGTLLPGGGVDWSFGRQKGIRNLIRRNGLFGRRASDHFVRCRPHIVAEFNERSEVPACVFLIASIPRPAALRRLRACQLCEQSMAFTSGRFADPRSTQDAGPTG